MLKLTTIVGARPQFIKAAAVSHSISHTPGIMEMLVHTGQHYDANMSDVFFDELEIPKPERHLGIAGGNHGAMTGKMLEAIEALLVEQKPDVVLVYGDTNSTLAGALAAAKLNIPLAHVEAGLRSFNKKMPEEINRILTDHCSTLLFAPTELAVTNLRNEGITDVNIVNCGDVMYDTALRFGDMAQTHAYGPEKFGLQAESYVLATIHRQENTDTLDRLEACVSGLSLVAQEIPVIFPLHPRTKARIESAGLLDCLRDIQVIDPVGYLDMVGLQKGAAVIATDSGGVQKEAFFHGVPCVTLRDETEWVELIEAGWNKIVVPSHAQQVQAEILSARGRQGKPLTAYGKGNAAQIIVESLLKRWGGS